LNSVLPQGLSKTKRGLRQLKTEISSPKKRGRYHRGDDDQKHGEGKKKALKPGA